MAFYKALENVELKKYSEATAEDFGVVFYSKGTFKTTKLFDKEVKKKVSAFFEDEKRSSLMISKEPLLESITGNPTNWSLTPY